MQHNTLYKRTSTGAIQIWYMESESNRYRSTSGQIDGKKTTTEWTVVDGKNQGRANETTPEQQALAEVEAEYKKKRKKDYRDSLDAVDVIERIKPMLATKWDDRKNKISQTEVVIDAKLDGQRCIATSQGLFSRTGEPILGVPHIHEHLTDLYFSNSPDLIIDGELYNNLLKDDFNTIVSCTKKQNPTEKEKARARELIQYWVYDLVSLANQPTSVRKQMLHECIDEDQFIKHTPSKRIPIEDVDEVSAEFIEMGYEGAMVRLEGPYENKRSKYLIKWKQMMDDEFIIVDIQEGDGNRSGMAARAIMSLPNGDTFSAGIIGNVPYCVDLLANKGDVVGHPGTVIFQNYTPAGVPRFPKFKGPRNYE